MLYFVISVTGMVGFGGYRSVSGVLIDFYIELWSGAYYKQLGNGFP
jgi:hypothetical protein